MTEPVPLLPEVIADLHEAALHIPFTDLDAELLWTALTDPDVLAA